MLFLGRPEIRLTKSRLQHGPVSLRKMIKSYFNMKNEIKALMGSNIFILVKVSLFWVQVLQGVFTI